MLKFLFVTINLNMVKSITLLTIVVLLGTFATCKKDDSPPATRTDLLVAPRVWKLTAWTVDPGLILQNGTTATDYYAILRPASRDDVIKFYRDPATYIEEEGASKDAGAAQVIDAGNWFLSIDETDLFLAPSSGLPLSFTIVELTSTTLKFSYVDVGASGNSRTYTKTYTAQR